MQTAPAQPQPANAVPADATHVVRDLFGLTKPRLSLLVLVTAGGGMGLSGGDLSLPTLLAGMGGTTLVVGAANILNNYLERESDKLMARTSNRALPAGRLDPKLALWVGVLLSIVSLSLLTLGSHPLAGGLAALALVLYVAVYTPMKRRSWVSVLVGAVPGALPPMIGWAAATGRIDAGAVVLFAIMFLWQLPHSLAIGLFRKSEYANAGLVVLPLAHGDHATRTQMVFYTALLLPVSFALLPLGVGGPITAVATALLGVTFLGMTLWGWKAKGDEAWARRVFGFSLIYATGLFAALGMDHMLL